MKILKKIFLILAIAYPPYVIIAPLFTDQTGSFFVFSYGMLLLILLLYTFPTYCAYLEIGYLIGGVIERKKSGTSEKIFDVIGALLSASIVVTLISVLIAESSGVFSLHLYLWAALVALWIVRALILKKKPKVPEELKTKSFWICTVALFLIISLWNAISYYRIKEKNQHDYYGVPSHEQEQAAVEQFMNYSL